MNEEMERRCDESEESIFELEQVRAELSDRVAWLEVPRSPAPRVDLAGMAGTRAGERRTHTGGTR